MRLDEKIPNLEDCFFIWSTFAPLFDLFKIRKVQNIYFWGCFLALKCFFSIFCPKLKFKIVSGKKTKKIKVYIFGILKWSKRGANMLQIKKIFQIWNPLVETHLMVLFLNFHRQI